MLALMMVMLAASEAVVALAGGVEVTSAQLRERVASTRAAGGVAQPELLVQDLVNEALLAQEGELLGLQKEPTVVAAALAERRKAAGERLVQATLGSVKVDDAQLLELFHSQADWVRLQLIVLATEAEARAALARLRAGGALADEAKRSLDPQTAQSGGEVTTRTRGQLPKMLADAAFAARPGVFTGPVKLELGFGVIKVVEREQGELKAFAEKRDQLRGFAEQQARARMRTHLVEQLRKQGKVTVDEAFLKSTGTRLQGPPAELEKIVATVGATPIRYAEVAAEVRRLFGGKEAGHASGPGVKIEMSWSLADRLLLGDAALARGLGEEPAAKAAARSAERDAVVRLLSARLRAQAPKPEAAEIEAHYRANAAAFQRPARHRCAHVLVARQEEAEKLRARLDGGEAFADLARDYSRDTATAATGGAIGELPEDRLELLAKSEPALAVALRTPPGAVSAPAKSSAGWHLVRCDAVLPAAAVPLAEVRESIAAQLAARKGDEAVRQHIAALRAGARIEVVPEIVLRGTAG